MLRISLTAVWFCADDSTRTAKVFVSCSYLLTFGYSACKMHTFKAIQCFHLFLPMAIKSSTLYQPQKLLSIDLEDPGAGGAPIPFNQRAPDQAELSQHRSGVGGLPEADGGDSRLFPGGDGGQLQLVQDRSWFPALAFLGTGLVVLFLLNQYYHARSRPRRRRAGRQSHHQQHHNQQNHHQPRKLQQLLVYGPGSMGSRVPGVWIFHMF